MSSQQSRSKWANRLFVLGLIVPCLLLSIPVVVTYRAQYRLADSFRWVSHTLEVQRELQFLRTLLLEAESDQRGFLLSSHAIHLQAYKLAIGKVPLQIARIRALTADNPAQQENMRQLDPLVAAKLDFIARTISFMQQDQREAMLELVGTERGKETMDAINRRLELMEMEESRLLTIREERLGSRARLSTGVLFALGALNALFTIAIFVMYRRLARAERFVKVCAWSRTVEFQGEWISFEQYLLRRFNLNTSHGISPAELEKALADVPEESKAT